MKHNDITVGVEYATGHYTKRRVRVVDVPATGAHEGVAVDQRRADDVAAMENRYGKPIIKRLDVAEGVGYVQHSTGYRGTRAKGAYAIELDSKTGEPRTLADGTLKIVFLHSRDFKAVWADHVAQVKADEKAAAIAAQRRAESQQAQNAKFDALLQRIAEHGLLDAVTIAARTWDKSKINGMWLKDWETLLDRVDEIAKGGAK